MAIEWVISSSVLAALVILLRHIFKGKISLKLQYCLWFLVLVRLLAPFSFGESRFSIMDAVKSTEQYEAAAEILNDTWVPSSVVVTNLSGQEVKETHSGRVYRATFSRMDTYYFADRLKIVLSKALLFIWLSGAAIKLLSFISINFRFARRLRKSRVPIDVSGCELTVYVADAAETPCLFGLLRPAIYVTPEIAGQDVMVRHVIPHELTHYQHGDHIWSLLRGLCLIIHWYNPIVRRAAELSQRDAELACDEATIKRIGEDERAEYGRTLIRMTIENRPSLLNASTTMTGTAVTIKERISFIARKPETAAYTLAVLLLISAAAVFVSYNGARDFTKPWHWAKAITCDDIAEAYPWYGIANGSALSDEETKTLVTLLNSLKPNDFEETGRDSGIVSDSGLSIETSSGIYYINEASMYGSLEIEYSGTAWLINDSKLAEFINELLAQKN